jgi:DNA-binding transcriptional LysR family regulator
MRLTLRQLQIFLAVAERGSTTGAAEQVALSQSAASAALNELENLLGTTLFDRIGKRLLINDQGRMLVPQAKQMLSLAQAVEMQFQGKGSLERDLRIGASTTIGTYLLPPLIAAYREGEGKVVPRVKIANTAEVASAVAGFDVEIGFIEGPGHADGVHAEPWLKDRLVIVASPTHELARRAGRKVTPAMLAKARWLLREAGSGTREAVEAALIPHLHTLNEGGEFGSSEAIKHACAAGLGLACLSHSVVQDLLEMGRVVEVRTTLPELSRTLYIVYSKKKLLSASLKDFRSFCRAWAKR